MQGAYPVPPPPKKSNTVLIVLLIVGGVVLLIVAVIGIFAVLAISGTRKYMSAAKAAEATNTIGQISRDAVAQYESESLDPTGTVTTHKLCSSASHPVPASMSDVRATKYMSTQSDWSADSAKNGGFYCLKFEMSMPQYYQYDYKVTGSGAKLGDAFTAQAKGDLDGDMEESTYSITGTIGSGDTVTLGAMKETNPDE